MTDWSDEQIIAARTCFVLAWRGPARHLSVDDIPPDQRLPTETDPIKLLQTERLRSREELTSEHLHRIASLTTESDRTATPEHLSQDRPDAQPWHEHARTRSPST